MVIGWKESKLQNEFKLMAEHMHVTAADSIASIRTAGGGGWGDPLDRDPEKVRWDVVEGFVSLEAAKREYGVILATDLSVDFKATTATRDRCRRNVGSDGAEYRASDDHRGMHEIVR